MDVQVMLDSICSNELADPDELISSEPMLCEASIRQRCCPKDRSLADWSPPPPTLSLLVISLYLFCREQGSLRDTSYSAASMAHLAPRRLHTTYLDSIARELIG